MYQIFPTKKVIIKKQRFVLFLGAINTQFDELHFFQLAIYAQMHVDRLADAQTNVCYQLKS